jgi:hypothetical protein
MAAGRQRPNGGRATADRPQAEEVNHPEFGLF